MLRALRAACADTVPIALRMVMGKSFPQGPFKLGMPHLAINAGAIVYMIVSVVGASSCLMFEPCEPS